MPLAFCASSGRVRTDSQAWEDDSATGLAVAAEKSLKLAARDTKSTIGCVWRFGMRSAILVLCVGAAAAASAPAAPTTSYGSCEKKDAYEDGHAKDDGHAGHRLLASAPPSDDDAPIKCNVKEDACEAATAIGTAKKDVRLGASESAASADESKDSAH